MMSLHSLAGKPAPPYNSGLDPHALSEPALATASEVFSARAPGTRDIYKLYAAGFRGEDHLHLIFSEAQAIFTAVFKAAGL